MTACAAGDRALPRSTSAGLALALVIGAGIVSAVQVGKATLALPSIRAELGVDLAAASWVLAAFALVGALASLPVGAIADRFQARPTVIAGLLLQAVGSALGAMAAGLPWLLAARVLEGLGFLAVTVAAPVMVVAATAPAARKRAFAAWATFMPAGMALVMLAAPLLTTLGWRGLWWINALVLAGYALALALGTRALRAASTSAARDGAWRGLRDTLGDGGAWFLAGQFFACSAVFFALFGFLPTLLGERLAVGAGMAGVLSAIAFAAGVAGCLACGALLQRGWRAAHLLALAFCTLALCGVGILLVPLPGVLAYALCLLFSFAGAFIPVVIFDAAPRLSPRPAALGAMVGLAMQGNNAGMVIGPVVAGAIAGAAGWAWVAAPVVLAALLTAASAWSFRQRLESAR